MVLSKTRTAACRRVSGTRASQRAPMAAPVIAPTIMATATGPAPNNGACPASSQREGAAITTASKLMARFTGMASRSA
jgi:hypothetical protein